MTLAMLLAPRLYAPKAPAHIKAKRVYASNRSRWNFAQRRNRSTNMNVGTAMRPASSGHATQVAKILIKAVVSVTEPLNRFQPMMAPTTAWLVDTGSPHLVIV